MGQAPRKSDLGGGEASPGLTSFFFWQSQKKRFDRVDQLNHMLRAGTY
jgi:hypothetical protein